MKVAHRYRVWITETFFSNCTFHLFNLYICHLLIVYLILLFIGLYTICSFYVHIFVQIAFLETFLTVLYICWHFLLFTSIHCQPLYIFYRFMNIMQLYSQCVCTNLISENLLITIITWISVYRLNLWRKKNFNYSFYVLNIVFFNC